MLSSEKKYLVPIEMDKEYAAKIGIPASEIKKMIIEGKFTEVYYVEVETEEMYHELMRPIWREEKEFQRNKKCSVKNENGKMKRCRGNCLVCPHCPSGTAISLEAMDETGSFRSTNDGVHRHIDTATYTESTEDVVMKTHLHEELYAQIAMLSPENQMIITMFSDGASEREIAEAVGMSQKGVNKRKKAIFEVLRKNLKDFL